MMEEFSSFDTGKFLTAKTGKVKQRSLRAESQWNYSKMGKYALLCSSYVEVSELFDA